MSNVELDCRNKQKRRITEITAIYYRFTLSTLVGTDCKQCGAQMGGGVGQFPQSVHVIWNHIVCVCVCVCNALASTSSSLYMCCLLGNPSLGQSQQGNGSREEKLLCRNIPVPFQSVPSTIDKLVLAKYYITQQPTAGLNVANYNNTTYFQLWTKCRDWSRSKQVENAAKKKTGISLATDIPIY